MLTGLLKEIRANEGRVALLPDAVKTLVSQGYAVMVESGAGHGVGEPDTAYCQAGAVVASREDVFSQADLLVKVKEPQPEEVELLRSGQMLFCFLHLAAAPQLLQALNARCVTALAFETLQDDGLPILQPMSELAGQLAVQQGAVQLYQHHGGRGVLLGRCKGASPGKVMVVGAGNAGSAAAETASNLGADVQVLDISEAALDRLKARLPAVSTHLVNKIDLGEALASTDLLVGAVLVPGARAPVVVSRSQIKAMPKGSVVVDIAIDQGGCIETSMATDYLAPVKEIEGVLHMGITNMPGAVPVSASQALSSAILPYLLELLKSGVGAGSDVLASAVNLQAGKTVLDSLK